MADYFTSMSSILNIPMDQLEKARVVLDDIVQHIVDEDEGYCGVDVDLRIDGGGAWIGKADQTELRGYIWFRGDQVSIDHVEIIARKLVEELDLPQPFLCSWANTCSRLRVDEFGGGAMRIEKGKPTFYVDAFDMVK